MVHNIPIKLENPDISSLNFRDITLSGPEFFSIYAYKFQFVSLSIIERTLLTLNNEVDIPGSPLRTFKVSTDGSFGRSEDTWL
uniref:Putative ovule protein n=1 Tax=Solanum chacoense TaxID=4108 RepID=A0A0V0HSJ5_SOLCH